MTRAREEYAILNKYLHKDEVLVPCKICGASLVVEDSALNRSDDGYRVCQDCISALRDLSFTGKQSMLQRMVEWQEKGLDKKWEAEQEEKRRKERRSTDD